MTCLSSTSVLPTTSPLIWSLLAHRHTLSASECLWWKPVIPLTQTFSSGGHRILCDMSRCRGHLCSDRVISAQWNSPALVLPDGNLHTFKHYLYPSATYPAQNQHTSITSTLSSTYQNQCRRDAFTHMSFLIPWKDMWVPKLTRSVLVQY